MPYIFLLFKFLIKSILKINLYSLRMCGMCVDVDDALYVIIRIVILKMTNLVFLLKPSFLL